MTAALWGLLGGAVSFVVLAALGDMVSEEVRDRLDHLPQAILCLAAWQLDEAERVTLYEEVWLPDLAYHLRGEEARPVTRLYHGLWFAFGILAGSRRMSKVLRAPGVPLPYANKVMALLSAPHLTGIAKGDVIDLGGLQRYTVVGPAGVVAGPAEDPVWLVRPTADNSWWAERPWEERPGGGRRMNYRSVSRSITNPRGDRIWLYGEVSVPDE